LEGLEVVQVFIDSVACVHKKLYGDMAMTYVVGENPKI